MDEEFAEETTEETPNPEEVETSEEPEEEGAEPSEEAEEETTEDTPEEHAKKGGVQKRIDKLTREKRELEQRLAALEQAAPKREEEAFDPDAFIPPGMPPEPQVEQFGSYEDYVRAVGRWEGKRVLAVDKFMTERNQTASRETAARNKVMTAGESKYEDFYEVIANAVSTPVMVDAILESESGAEISYYLGKNPGVAKQIASLSPVAQAKAIGKIEAELEKANVNLAKKEVKKQPTTVEKTGTPAPRANNTLKDLKAEAQRTGSTEAWARYIEAGGT